MKKSCALASVPVLQLAVCLPVVVMAQQVETARTAPRVAIALKISSLGAGIEMAARVAQHSNVRSGFNFFDYDQKFKSDGLVYDAQLNLRSLQTNYDWFPFAGSFHVSPGLLVYNGNRAGANISTPVSCGNYWSGTATGTAKIEFRRVAPMFLVGWGNLLPRHRHRFNIPFEFGVVYHGTPRASLAMNAIACDPSDAICAAVRADPDVYNGFHTEQAKIRSEVAPFQFYPVVSAGFGYSF